MIKDRDDLGNVRTRFASLENQDQTRDMHDSGPDANVKLMNYCLRIFWEHEIKELTGYELIPVAILEHEDNTVSISQDFIPPAVTTSASDTLRQTVHNIRDQICSRCGKLEEYKTPKGIQTSDIDINYITYLMALRSLARYVPLIHHMCDAEHMHPWEIFGLLKNIVGELSVYTDRIDSLGKLGEGTELLPSYDHENLFRCFEDAQTLISELLSELVIGPESIIHLKRENSQFAAQVPGELFIGSHTYYIVIRTAEKTGNVLSVMEHIAKVSSMEHMSTLTGRALPGLKLIHSPLPPPGIPTRPNSFYFEIDQTDAQWSEIQKSQSICLHWPQAPKDTNIQLIVLRK
jgi:type VI secretion system protein ImpJ